MPLRRLVPLLVALSLAFAAALPATGSAAALSVRFPPVAVAGQALTISGTAPKAARKGQRVRLQRRGAHRRWTTVASGKVGARRAFRLRFTPAQTLRTVILRVQVLRGKHGSHVLATSRAHTLKLRVAPRHVSAASSNLPTVATPVTPVRPATPPAATTQALVLHGSPVTLAPGSVATLAVPAPLERFQTLTTTIAPPAGLSMSGDGAATPFRLASAAAASPQAATVSLGGTGCTATACDVPFVLTVPVTIRGLAAPANGLVEGFTSPSPDRIAAGTQLGAGAGIQLGDQVTVTLGTPDIPGDRSQADDVAAALGGVVSGGLEELGVYEIRWTSGQDIAARIAQAEAMDDVTAAAPEVVGVDVEATTTPPGDWDDDGPEETWPFQQVRAPQAWDLTTGGDTAVGIVDAGTVFIHHEDLDVEQVLGDQPAATHATHVAGLACAKANGRGVVGMAWGCPILSTGIVDSSPDQVLLSAVSMAETGVGVINMSLGYYYGYFCHTAAQQQHWLDYSAPYKAAFRHLFQGPLGRDIVWTIAAGNNCDDGVPSPWGMNSDLPNVITVASTNDTGVDGGQPKLSSFSDFGTDVEVAAPGGEGDDGAGIWSTWFLNNSSCGFLGLHSQCGSYRTDEGTSMSAPIVAGIAALVRSEHPDYSASTAAACIEQSAGETTGYADGLSTHPTSRTKTEDFDGPPIPIVDAEAAVRCTSFDSEDAGSYVGSWAGNGWLLSVTEDSPGELGAVNQGYTPFTNGCYVDPGLRIMQNVALDSDTGQWEGDMVTTEDDCSTFSYDSSIALRAVRYGDEVDLVLAWPQSPSGTRPAIDADGDITSDTPYFELYLTRPGDGDEDARAARGIVAVGGPASGHVPTPGGVGVLAPTHGK